MAEQFKWVSFYTEFASKLLEYKKDRASLIEKLQKIYSDIGMKLPKLEKDNVPKGIDPFTIFGLFNKGITDANRVSILGGIKSEFSIAAEVPDDFSGIPVLNNMMATFYAFEDDDRRKDDDIDNLWNAFEVAIKLAESDSEESRAAFTSAYDQVMLNVVLFGKTAKQCKEENSTVKGNMRDTATLNQLLVLANLESYNAVLINQGKNQKERMELLRQLAVQQLQTLETVNLNNLPKLERKM